MKPFRLSMPLLIGLIPTLIMLHGCGESNEFVAPPPPQVTVARPVDQEVVTYREFIGRTAPVESVEVRARVRGFLDEIQFEEGDTVAKGDPLFTIEQASYAAAVQSAKADLAQARAQKTEAEFELEKVKGVYERGAGHKLELVAAQAAYDGAVAAESAAEAAIAAAELDLGYTRIAAPIDGRINRSRVDPGNLVGQGEATLLTTIVRWNPIYVYFNVSERDVLEFRRRQAKGEMSEDRVIQVYLRLADGTDYQHVGQVDYVDNRVDPDTGTIQVRAIFDNPDELLVPGILARIRVPTPPQQTLLVPEVALQRDLSGYFLLIVDDEGMIDRRNVEVAEQIGNVRMIASGLSPDERVIIKGLQRARPGIKAAAGETSFDPGITMPRDLASASRPSTAPASDNAGGGA